MEVPVAPLVAAAILASAYAAGAWLSAHGANEGFWARRRWVSAAAGVSVAYVFVDVLPELAAQNRAIVAAAGNEPLLFTAQRIYVLALLSFVVLYGLQYVVIASRERRPRRAASEGSGIYALHVAGFAAYSVLIGYLLIERAERGTVALAGSTFAMALHFLIVDHSLNEEHGDRYERAGRWVLVASVLAGCLLGMVTTISEVVFARLFAILAGGVVITSLRAELPDERRGRFWPFCLGAVGYTAVLLFT